MKSQIRGQTTIFDFMETPETPKVDFSCFSSFRVGKFGVESGKCSHPELKGKCNNCEAFKLFYSKAKQYQECGEKWCVCLALAREFFHIPTVPERTVEYYRKQERR